MTEAVFKDTHELLSMAPEFWIFFSEDVYHPHYDDWMNVTGLYHWIADVYCFIMDSQAMTITFGHPNTSQHYYTASPDLVRAFRVMMVECRDKLSVVLDAGQTQK